MLNVRAFGLSTAILWTIAVAWTWILAMTGKGNTAFNLIDEYYFGLIAATFPGLLLASLLAFVDGFVVGAVFAWIYNKLAKRRSA